MRKQTSLSQKCDQANSPDLSFYALMKNKIQLSRIDIKSLSKIVFFENIAIYFLIINWNLKFLNSDCFEGLMQHVMNNFFQFALAKVVAKILVILFE